MIKEITDSLVKFLADNGIQVGVNNDNLQDERDIISLGKITPFVFVEGDGVEKMEIHYLIYLFGNDDEIYRKLDKWLEVKSASEQPFPVVDISSGIAQTTDNFTIKMPYEMLFKVPLGKPIVDEIVITIRRLR